MIVSERNKDNSCSSCSKKNMSCSFLDIVGSVCGAEERARHPSTQTVLLSSCSKDIRSHKRFLQFSGVETNLESHGEELVDYVLCLKMSPVTKRNLKKYPQQKGELFCSTHYKFLNLRKTLYLSDQVSYYNVYSHFMQR